jgi:hypothetical protein
MALTKVTYSMIEGGAVNVLDYGANGDGVADNKAAFQAAFDAVSAQGGGCIYIPEGEYLISGVLYVPSNTRVSGAGVGATIIKHPSSEALRNENYPSDGPDTNITIENLTCDAQGTGATPISMIGISQCYFDTLELKGMNPVGVTVGIGIGAKAAHAVSNIFISNCNFFVPDYGIVLQGLEGKSVRGAYITNCNFVITWGSGISCAGQTRKVTISNCGFEFNGLPEPTSGDIVGIGVKLWQGTNINNGPQDTAITGCSFVGRAIKDVYFGISAANFTQNTTVTGCTFRQMTYAYYNNFSGSGTLNTVFSSNVVDQCNNGFWNDDSSDVSPVITNNTFTNGIVAIRSSLRHAVVSGNKITDMSNAAIIANNPCLFASITGNTFARIGRAALQLLVDGTNSTNISFSSNTLSEICTAADDTYSCIELNNQAHSITNNVISNQSTTVKPKWIIADGGSANNRIITSNWMFGARDGYVQTSGANDVYANNRERGGIG